MQPDRVRPQPQLNARTAPTAFALRSIADRKARGRLRAAATVEAIGKGELEWLDAEGWRYELEAPPVVTIAPKDIERAAATVDLKVWDTAGTLIFRDRIHAWDGFPVLVPDGSQHEEDDGLGGKVRVSNFRESPVEAARSDLAHTVRVVTKNGPWVKTKPGTVSTFYASTDDNRISCGDGTYSVARSGAGTLDDAYASNAALFVGQTTTYKVWQSFVPFDTSAIPDADTVTDFTLSFDGRADGSNVDFVVEARIVDWGATIEAADFVAGDDLGNHTLIASFNSSAYSTAYMDFTTESGVAGQLSLTGLTKVHLSSAEQRLNSAPTDFEYLQLNSANNSGTTHDPKLVVTHAAASVPFRRSLLGVGF